MLTLGIATLVPSKCSCILHIASGLILHLQILAIAQNSATSTPQKGGSQSRYPQISIGTKDLDLLLSKLRYDHVGYHDIGYLIPYIAISHTDVMVVKFS